MKTHKLIFPILLLIGCTSVTGVNETYQQPEKEPTNLNQPLPEQKNKIIFSQSVFIDTTGLEEPDPCYWDDPCHNWVIDRPIIN